MEIEKIVRILAVVLVVAAFAVNVATRLMFPEASQASSLPIAIVLILCLCSIWAPSKTKTENPNK